MSTYICIQNGDETETYPTNTETEIALAQEALRAAGLESAPIWHGEPDCSGDAYRDPVQVLRADSNTDESHLSACSWDAECSQPVPCAGHAEIAALPEPESSAHVPGGMVTLPGGRRMPVY